MRYRLEGTVDGQSLGWDLDPGTHSIGRAKENEIRLPDQSISRAHARLLVEEHRLIVEDLGSRNGTFLNGDKVTTAECHAGDTLQLGSIRLHLLSDEMPRHEGTTLTPELSEPGQVHASSSLDFADAKAELHTDSKVYQTLFQIMSEAGNLLVVPRPFHELLDTMLVLVERLIPAGRIILLLRKSEDSDPVVCASRPPLEAAERIMLSKTLINNVLENRRSLLVTDAQSDPRFRDHQSIIALNLRSAVAAPLFDNEKVIGLIYADTTTPGLFYDKDLLRAFTILANLIAVKITNHHLLDEQREKERLKLDAEAAGHYQKLMLPLELPEAPGYEMVAYQVPSREAAGDLYDSKKLSDGAISIVLGDVSGKGTGAAFLMSGVMHSLNILYEVCPDLVELAERLNQRFFESSSATTFVTLCLGKLDPQAHRLQYVGAGHNPPLLVCKDGVTELPSTGLPIGLLGGSKYERRDIELPPGCILCIYSDGITEAQKGEEFYGETRLIEALKKRLELPLKDVVTEIMDDVAEFLEDEEADDDITIFLLRRQA